MKKLLLTSDYGLQGLALQTNQPVIVFDYQADGRLKNKPAALVAGEKLVSQIAVPLHGKERPLGTLTVGNRKPTRFTDRQAELLEALGNWAAVAIETSRLYEKLESLARLEERERIGMDLHDGIIQSIYAVGLALDYAQSAVEADPRMARLKIEQAVEGLNNAIRDIRSYILDLHPRQFRGEDLMVGLQQLVDEFIANSRTQATLVGPKNGLVTLPTPNATALFHICQEALANVARHSRAPQVNVHLWTNNDRVILEIADNGRGFDLRKMSVTLGHGLSNMHVRAHKVGGNVEIASEPGEGTTVMAWVPRQVT